MRVKFIVGETDDNFYENDDTRWPLLRTIWEVLKHRAWHWQRGDGWID